MSASFNGDQDTVALALTTGFKIFTIEPYSTLKKRNIGPYKIVHLLHRTNILILVGNGENSHCPSQKLIFWDDIEQKVVGEIANKHEILNATIHTQMAIIADKNKVALL